MNSNDISVEEFAAAVYQGDWYIGKVCDIDHEDKEIEISFLQMRKMAYQWPSRQDKIWVCLSDILCKINAPTATGKTGRMLKIDESEREKITSAFDFWRQKSCDRYVTDIFSICSLMFLSVQVHVIIHV